MVRPRSREHPTGLGELHAVATALEQLDAEALLALGESLVYRWLGQVDPFRRLIDAAARGDLGEKPADAGCSESSGPSPAPAGHLRHQAARSRPWLHSPSVARVTDGTSNASPRQHHHLSWLSLLPRRLYPACVSSCRSRSL